jgi:hypothetical protein
LEVKVKCKIEFQYKSPKSSRPQEEPQDEPIELREGEFVPIPNVGDSVGFLYGGKNGTSKLSADILPTRKILAAYTWS